MAIDVKRRPPLHLAPPIEGAPPRDREHAMADALFSLGARVNEIDSDVIDVKLALIRIENKMGAASAPYRDPEASYQEFDPALASFRQTMRQRVKDPNDPLNGQSASEFLQAMQTAVKERKELAIWRWIKHANSRFWWEVIKAIVQLAVGGGIVELLHKTGH